MSTLEEFENAPPGSTATRVWKRAVKTFYDGTDRTWLSRDGEWLSAQELVEGNWTLDPTPTVPTSARDALDLAWELAHPVKAGDKIPEGGEYFRLNDDGTIQRFTVDICPWRVHEGDRPETLRTLDRLDEIKPMWTNAPAVFAAVDTCSIRTMHVTDGEHTWRCVCTPNCPDIHYWDELRDVTPLYPKEDA